jgi:hypothetical protein
MPLPAVELPPDDLLAAGHGAHELKALTDFWATRRLRFASAICSSLWAAARRAALSDGVSNMRNCN